MSGLTACGGEEPAPQYQGTAYPNRRPTFESQGRWLGYVANRYSDTVSVVDLDSMTELGAPPVGRNPVDVDGPRELVFDEAAGLAYVVLSYPLDEVGPHAAEGGATERPGYIQALDLVDFRPMGELRVDPNAMGLGFSRESDQLVVSHYDALRSLQRPDLESRRAKIDVIRPASGLADGSARARSLTLCVAPTSVVVRRDGTRAYVACTGEDAIAVVDTVNAQVLARVTAGVYAANKPYALVADPREELLVVSNQVGRAVALFSMTDEPSLIASVDLLGVPWFAGWLSESQLLVPTQDYNGAALIDVTTASIVREISYSRDLCENPSEVQRTEDGRVFLVCEGNHFSPGAVVQLDPTTLEIVARVAVGHYPERMAIRPPSP